MTTIFTNQYSKECEIIEIMIQNIILNTRRYANKNFFKERDEYKTMISYEVVHSQFMHFHDVSCRLPFLGVSFPVRDRFGF